MVGELDLDTVGDFAAALLIGTLLGIERERHKQTDGDASVGGLRTFILFALLGALGGWLAVRLDFPWILVAVVLATLVAVVASYVAAARVQPDALGLTTELAAVATTLLGAMVMLGHREIAVALTVAIAAVLAYKQPLHGLVSRLDREDVYAGVRLLAATFIVLPLLPDRTIDPWDALNPLQALATGAPDLRVVPRGVRRGPTAGAGSRHPSDGTHRRTRLLDGDHPGVRAPEPREGPREGGARVRLRHPDRVERDVPAGPGNGADRQSRAARAARRFPSSSWRP